MVLMAFFVARGGGNSLRFRQGFRTRRGLPQFCPEATHEFRRQVGNSHAFGNQELATQDGTGLVVVGQLAIYSAMFATLVPTKPAIGNCFRADELKGAQKRVPLGHQKGLTQDGDLDQFFVRSQDVRHGRCPRISHSLLPTPSISLFREARSRGRARQWKQTGTCSMLQWQVYYAPSEANS